MSTLALHRAAGWARVDSQPWTKCAARWAHPSGWRIEHCGHPTALRPWALYDPAGLFVRSGAKHGRTADPNAQSGGAWTSLVDAMDYVATQVGPSSPLANLSPNSAKAGILTPPRAAHLFAHASTPGDVCELLGLRGRARLGQLLLTYRAGGGNVESTALLFETLATHVERTPRPSMAYLEPRDLGPDGRVTARGRAEVAAALRWAASAWRRWDGRGRPEPGNPATIDASVDVGPVDAGAMVAPPWQLDARPAPVKRERR